MSSLTQKLESRLRGLPVPVAFELPGGQRLGPAGAALRLAFQDWTSVARLAAGQIGAAGKGFVEDRIRLQGSMRDLMAAAVGWLSSVDPTRANSDWLTRAVRGAGSVLHHTRQRDARNIEFHYDVSDDFYALWLDPRRVYSCAYFRDADMTLAQAQEAKLDLICRKLMLQPGERFLDIGAGWGALLLWAAEHYGVDATGITLSRNQHAHVTRLIEQKGLGGRVRMELRDYRDLDASEPFDKIASVGMFEHVGRANMVGYFEKVFGLLRPGGLVLNHGITAGGLDNRGLGAGLSDFVQEYIFPGGELLHVSLVLEDMAKAGLEMVDCENLRPHYARTLWQWSDGLESHLDEARQVLESSRPDDTSAAEKTLRAYRLYLAGSAMCFEEGWIALHQMLAARPTHDHAPVAGGLPGAQSDYPFNRSYIYNPN